MPAALSAALLAAAAAAIGLCQAAPALAGAETALDKVKALLDEKRRLQWDNDRIREELAFASTPSPYVVIDPGTRTFEFRVRGKSHKSYAAESIEIVGRNSRPISVAELGSIAAGPVAVVEKAQGPPEFTPPALDPNAAGAAEDPNAEPRQSDAMLLGVDAPADYDIDLDKGIRLEIRTRHEKTRWQRATEAFSTMGRAVTETVGGWFTGVAPGSSDEPRARVRITFDEKSAKAFYHSVLPGEHFYFRPGLPPPVSLVAAAAPQAPAASPAATKPAPKKAKASGGSESSKSSGWKRPSEVR
jgi:hypothetical protein